MAFNNSNIQFLQGSYNALKQLTTSQPGAFYVTNDTHEMFLGVDANKAPVALNRWVDVRDSWADVQKEDYKQHPGKIYYAIAENILCTWNATKQQWIQINPDTDTNDNTSVASISFAGSPEAVKEGDKVTGYKYILTLLQQDKDGNKLTPELTAEFTITNDMVTSLVVDVAVGLTASIDDGTATISTVGAGSNNDEKVTLTGSGGVTVDGTNNDIIITGTTYELISPKEGTAEVVLQSSRGANTKVLFEGDTWIAPAANGEGNIKIEHSGPGEKVDYEIAYSNATDEQGNIISSAINATDRKFTALTGIQKDAKGHIVGVTQTEFTVPDSNYKLQSDSGTVTIGEGEDAQIATYTTEVQLATQIGTKVSGTAIETAHTITVDGVQRIVANGGNFGSFYSASTIDNKFKLADAMVYRGSVDSIVEIEGKTGLHVGDTFKAGSEIKDFDLGYIDAEGNAIKVTVAPGDLLIANVKEGTFEEVDGTISDENLVWDHIATGADIDTQYKIQGTNNKIQLIYANGVNANNIVEGAAISVTDDDTYIITTVEDNNLNIAHATKDFANVDIGDKADTAKPTSGSTIKVVTGVRKDDAGHIDGVTTTTVTLPGADKVVVTKDHFAITDAENNTKGDLHFVDKLSEDTDNHKISVKTEVDKDNDKILRVTFDHDTQTVEVTTGKDENINLSAEADEDRAFDVLESVSYDDYGHITKYQSKKVTIGKQSVYDLTDPSIANNVVTQTMQRDGSISVGAINLTSNTLKYKVDNASGTPLTYIDIVWGSFETTV